MTLLHELGAIWLFSLQVFRTFLTTKGNFQPILAQIASISLRTLPTVIFSGIFVGGILVLQLNLILSKYDAQSLLGGLNTSTIIRQVGPLIISFLLAGKIGAFTAAELGTMRVTEQIDAIECLGTHPIQYLIVPRFLGIMVSSLFLLLIGLTFSIVGAMGIAKQSCGINFLQFMGSIPKFTDFWTLTQAIIQSLIYGTIVAAVSCHQGFTAKGGARGVGQAVTRAAVYTNFYIVLANWITNHFLNFFEQIVKSGYLYESSF